MAHNQHMLETRGAEWGDRVRIISLSADESMEVLKKHIEKNNWGSVENYHMENGVSTAS